MTLARAVEITVGAAIPVVSVLILLAVARRIRPEPPPPE